VYVCILPEKAVSEMTYTVSGVTVNPTQSVGHLYLDSDDVKECGN